MSTERLQRRKPPDRDRVAQLIAEIITRPREATPQVLQHVLAYHEVPEGEVTAWLERELPRVEAYEMELILSPLFTPDDDTRLVVEDLLGTSFLTAEDIEYVLEDLAGRDLEIVIVVDGELVGIQLPRIVTERFVRLLHADTPLPGGDGEVARLIDGLGPEARRHLREPTWLRPSHRDLFPTLLDAARRVEGDIQTSIRFLTDFVRSHRPASREDCLRCLTDVADAYEEDLRRYKSGERSFFDNELKATHAGKWSVSEDTITAHERAIALARALHAALGN